MDNNFMNGIRIKDEPLAEEESSPNESTIALIPHKPFELHSNGIKSELPSTDDCQQPQLGDDDATPPRLSVKSESLETYPCENQQDFPADFFDELLDENIVKAEMNNVNNTSEDALDNVVAPCAEVAAKFEKLLPDGNKPISDEESKPKKSKKEKKSKKKRRRHSSSDSQRLAPPVKREHMSPDNSSESSSTWKRKRRDSIEHEISKQNEGYQTHHTHHSRDANSINQKRESPPQTSKILNNSVSAPKSTLKLRSIHNLLPAGKETRAEIEETFEMRSKRALKNAAEAIKLLNAKTTDGENTEVGFQYARVICKLPNKKNYMSQQFFENHSPLCNNYNVAYKFSSTKGEIILANWGLVSLTPYPAKICRKIGFDFETIRQKLETIKVPPKLLKLIESEQGASEENMKACRIAQTSCLYNTASTQTENNTNYHLAKPTNQEIGVQTDAAKEERGLLDLRKRSKYDIKLVYMILDAMDNPPATLAQENEVITEVSDALRTALTYARS